MWYKLNTETEMLEFLLFWTFNYQEHTSPPSYHDLFLIPDEFTL